MHGMHIVSIYNTMSSTINARALEEVHSHSSHFTVKYFYILESVHGQRYMYYNYTMLKHICRTFMEVIKGIFVSRDWLISVRVKCLILVP